MTAKSDKGKSRKNFLAKNAVGSADIVDSDRIYNMNVGDLVSWAEYDLVARPWFYDAWRDVGIVIDECDADSVCVYWATGETFIVWNIELVLLSSCLPLTEAVN